MHQSLDNLLREINSEYEFPAIAAAVASREGLMAAGAIGVRRVRMADAVTLEDRFHLGSITKPMTSTVLATIVEDGFLRWDSTLLEVFPEMDGTIHPALRSVRLENLLSHRAGIAPFETDEEAAHLPPFSGSSRDQRLACVHWLLSREPAIAPLSDHLYSNAGYGIAAAMGERVLNMPWETLVRQRLFERLPMPSGGFGWPAREDARQPWGHRKPDADFVPHSPHDAYTLAPLLVPAGDIHASITDLVQFGRMHILGLSGQDTLIRAETMRRIHTPVGEYGLGWNISPTSHQHSGSAETFSAVLLLRPQSHLAYAFATNAVDLEGTARLLATAVLQRLVDRVERGAP